MQRRLPGVSREAKLDVGSTGAEEAIGNSERCFAPINSAREARAAVLALPLDDDRKERAVLVVSELATNAIVHAGGILSLYLRQHDCHLRIEVADASPALPRPAKVSLTSGRGLKMVEALATAWGSEPQPWGKIVWADLD
jgi:two-component sensor histidine kinase